MNLGHPEGWLLPAALCLLTGVSIVVTAVDGSPHPMYLPLGIALYVAAVGVVVAMIGSVLLRWGAAPSGLTAAVADDARCPRCARSVEATDRTCKYCGLAVGRYRSNL